MGNVGFHATRDEDGIFIYVETWYVWDVTR